MKKKNIVIISVVVILAATIVGIFVFLGQKDKPNAVPETTQGSVSVTSTQNEYETEAETETPTVPKSGELLIERSSSKFRVTKTDFEKRYSDEFLMDIAGMLGMNFGCEDFGYWNEDSETVVNSLLGCCVCSYKFPFQLIYTEDEQLIKKGNAELDKIFPEEKHSCSGFVNPDMLNAYFEDLFGPDVRKFTTKDFMTHDEAIAKNGEPYAKDHPEGFSEIRSLPESDLLCFYTCGTGFSSYSSYVYDIREVKGDYVVYTLGDVEAYWTLNSDFNSNQAEAFRCLTLGGSEYVENYVYTFGCTDDGNLYLKSIDKRFLFAEDCEFEYRITENTVAINDVSYLFPTQTVGRLDKGEIVYVRSIGTYQDEEVAFVITEDFAGYVDSDCVEKIG